MEKIKTISLNNSTFTTYTSNDYLISGFNCSGNNTTNGIISIKPYIGLTDNLYYQEYMNNGVYKGFKNNLLINGGITITNQTNDIIYCNINTYEVNPIYSKIQDSSIGIFTIIMALFIFIAPLYFGIKTGKTIFTSSSKKLGKKYD